LERDGAAIAEGIIRDLTTLISTPAWHEEDLVGLATIVLTHRDDVADHDRWAQRFGCPRWIHAADSDAAPGAEHLLQGEEPLDLDAHLRLTPVPGHTAGSLVALLGGQILFSGDHLWWSDTAGAVVASRTYCWHDWERQLASVAKLRELDVRWLLPGHGGRRRFDAGEWAPQIDGVLSYWGASGAAAVTQRPSNSEAISSAAICSKSSGT
jgi:glyoxylase-like metal-dependent hydrolase (beta-lactamase superfamily II)